MKKHLLFYSLAFIAVSAAQAGIEGGWDPANQPKWFNNTSFNSLNLDYRFDRLPAKGEMKDHLAWSDSYWPSNLGGIAFRWNDPRAAQYTDTEMTDAESVDLRKSLGFTYKLYSKAEVARLTYDQLAALSPAEKYDIFKGDFDYPTVKHERKKTNVNQPYWFGICDGWTPAALNHAEPAAINEKDANGIVRSPVYSKDGFVIPFGSSDVKAIISHYYNRTHENSPEAWIAKKKYKIANAALIGKACKTDITKSPTARTLAECADSNAGAFHVIMTNQLGRAGRGFGIDVDAGVEIWNQPVFAYHSEVIAEQGPSRGAAKGTVREAIIKTDLYYGDDTFKGKAYWNPVVGTDTFSYDVVKYQYRVEIDASGNIIGGEWMNRDHSAEYGWLDGVDRNSAKFHALNDYERPPVRADLEVIHNRPDQLWIQREANFREGFNEYYADIYKIYRPAKVGPVNFRTIPAGYETAKAEYDEYMSKP